MPGLRENIKDKLSREPNIDTEFSTLIPPLNADEYSRLEQSIIDEGCRDAIILWNNIIIDGHNRYRICKKHNLPYKTITRDFASRQDVIIWMLQNQLSRRNLTDFQRIEIVRKSENLVKAQAVKRQEATRFGSGGGNFATTIEKSRDTLGSMAGVSGKTYEHATAILDKAPEAVINAVRLNELSINAGYAVTKLPPEERTEIAERIENGEKPAQAVSQVKKRISAKQTHGLTLHLSPEDIAQIKILAQKSNMDISSMCVRLIHEALQTQQS